MEVIHLSNDAPLQPANPQTHRLPKCQRRLDVAATALASLVALAGIAGVAGAYLYRPKGVEGFVDEMPNAQKRILSDCGHSAHEDCPDQAIPAIAAFLARAL